MLSNNDLFELEKLIRRSTRKLHAYSMINNMARDLDEEGAVLIVGKNKLGLDVEQYEAVREVLAGCRLQVTKEIEEIKEQICDICLGEEAEEDDEV